MISPLREAPSEDYFLFVTCFLYFILSAQLAGIIFTMNALVVQVVRRCATSQNYFLTDVTCHQNYDIKADSGNHIIKQKVFSTKSFRADVVKASNKIILSACTRILNSTSTGLSSFAQLYFAHNEQWPDGIMYWEAKVFAVIQLKILTLNTCIYDLSNIDLNHKLIGAAHQSRLVVEDAAWLGWLGLHLHKYVQEVRVVISMQVKWCAFTLMFGEEHHKYDL